MLLTALALFAAAALVGWLAGFRPARRAAARGAASSWLLSAAGAALAVLAGARGVAGHANELRLGDIGGLGSAGATGRSTVRAVSDHRLYGGCAGAGRRCCYRWRGTDPAARVGRRDPGGRADHHHRRPPVRAAVRLGGSDGLLLPADRLRPAPARAWPRRGRRCHVRQAQRSRAAARWGAAVRCDAFAANRRLGRCYRRLARRRVCAADCWFCGEGRADTGAGVVTAQLCRRAGPGAGRDGRCGGERRLLWHVADLAGAHRPTGVADRCRTAAGRFDCGAGDRARLGELESAAVDRVVQCGKRRFDLRGLRGRIDRCRGWRPAADGRRPRRRHRAGHRARRGQGAAVRRR